MRRALLLAVFFTFATPAYAGGLLPIAPDGTVCPFNGLTERIVLCVGTVLNLTVQAFLIPFSSYLHYATNAAMLLAVIIFGSLMFAGRIRPVAREAIVLGLKIGFIVLLVNGSYGLYTLILGIMDEMIAIVINYVNIAANGSCPASPTPWGMVDCMLDKLIGGILPGTGVASGIGGFVVASLFSGVYAVPVFFLGLAFIFIFLMGILQALFIYINAYIGVALLAMMAPLFIPMILFKSTKAYFEKWLRLLLGLVIQPIFLFAYLTMLLITFNVIVYSLYVSILGPDPAINNPNFRIGNYLGAISAYADSDMLEFSQNIDPKELSSILSRPGAVVDMGALGNLGQSLNKADTKKITVGMNTNAVDYEYLQLTQGITFTQYIVNVIASFFSAVTIAYVFYTLLQVIPFLGQGISGEILSIPNLARGLLGSGGGGIMDSLRSNMGFKT